MLSRLVEIIFVDLAVDFELIKITELLQLRKEVWCMKHITITQRSDPSTASFCEYLFVNGT